MVDQLADRWRDLIDRRDELLRLGRESAARRIDAEVARLRNRMARILCSRSSVPGAAGIDAGGRPDWRTASEYFIGA
jgi:hypothetical protein